VEQFDVIIIGAGAMGSASAFYLAKEGKKVLLLEQFELLHNKGSSHGESRIIRRAYPEKHFADLMPYAYDLWHDIEKETGNEIIQKTGGLDFGSRKAPELNSVESACQSAGINFEKMDANDLRNRFPVLNILDDYIGIYQPDAGIINATKAVSILQDLSKKLGAKLVSNSKVINIEHGNSGITVKSNMVSYFGSKLIISAGAWVNSILKLLDNTTQLNVDIWKLTIAYWKVLNKENYTPPYFPIFINWGKDHYYGFPISERSEYIKIGPHFEVETITDIENKTTDPNPIVTKQLEEYVKNRFNEIEPIAVDSQSCLYTMTDDENFVIDFHPRYSNVIIAAGFSGHGFKFTPLIGKMISQLAVKGTTEFNISQFTIQSKLRK
jgi:monomeric sarcosine oxidase